MLRKFLYKLKHGTEYLNYGREIVADWAVGFADNFCCENVRILDIGCGRCEDISNIRTKLSRNPATLHLTEAKSPLSSSASDNASNTSDNSGGRGSRSHSKGETSVELFGVETFEPYVKIAQQQGITIFPINLENQLIPLENSSVDIVIANQIFEHTKEIFWIMAEISRVLREGGIAIVGVPNLGSLHNRLGLLFGQQPTCINLMSEHVRGFTKRAFKEFCCTQHFFKLLDFKGSNFYPFPPSLSKILSKILPNLSVSIFFLLQRTNKPGTFIEILQSTGFANSYFAG